LALDFGLRDAGEDGDMGWGMGAEAVAYSQKHLVAWGPEQLPDFFKPHRPMAGCDSCNKSCMVERGRPSIQMKIALVYIYAPVGGPQWDGYAMRFLESYHANPPGIEHECVVVLNGCRQSSEITCFFSSLRNCCFLEHDDSGYDIGGYQLAARTIPCDLMVFFGGSTFFLRPGWLIRMANSVNLHGNALYGAMGNRGNSQVGVWPHIRTTAFWCDPRLMNEYPIKVTTPGQRFPFEHGRDCFTAWVKNRGLRSWVITWTRDLLWKEWDDDCNGYQRGNQSSLLAADRMCEAPYYPQPKR
jgi:hypothetical protein